MSSIRVERPVHKKSVRPLSGFLRKFNLEFGQFMPSRASDLHATLAIQHDSALDLAQLARITRERPDTAGDSCELPVRGVVRVGQTAVGSSIALSLYDTDSTLYDESAYYREALDLPEKSDPFLPHITLGKAIVVRANGDALMSRMQSWADEYAPTEVTLAPVHTRMKIREAHTDDDATHTITKTAS